MRKLIAIIAVTGALLTNSLSAQAVSEPGGCRLSANWYVKSSVTFYGNDFGYGVLNSPGPLRVGGYPDGTVSEFFLFRDNELRYAGAYRSRDSSHPESYVYRTQTIPGEAPGARNVDNVVQIAMAPSGIWCRISTDRP